MIQARSRINCVKLNLVYFAALYNVLSSIYRYTGLIYKYYHIESTVHIIEYLYKQKKKKMNTNTYIHIYQENEKIPVISKTILKIDFFLVEP